jgi:hypothetical protein
MKKEIKKLLEERKLFLRYVRNKQGFAKGVVLGLVNPDGTVSYGWSAVHSDWDQVEYTGSLTGLPSIAKQLSVIHALLNDSGSPYLSGLNYCLDNLVQLIDANGVPAGCPPSKPAFDRNLGITIAYNRACSVSSGVAPGVISDSDVQNSLMRLMFNMRDRLEEDGE